MAAHTPNESNEPEIAAPEDAAVGAVYTALARLFEEPTTERYEALADGSLQAQLGEYIEAAGLADGVTVPDLVPADDDELLAARFNDIFAVGYPEPPVPLYESAYYDESYWERVNVDLARVYEYFGVSVDDAEREHHDHLVLELEFAGYLARLAAVEDRDDVRKARRDFLDRHLVEFATELRSAVDEEVETGIYDGLVAFLVEFVEADHQSLADVDLEDDESEGPETEEVVSP